MTKKRLNQVPLKDGEGTVLLRRDNASLSDLQGRGQTDTGEKEINVELRGGKVLRVLPRRESKVRGDVERSG